MWPVTLSGRLPVSLGKPLPYQQADRIWAYLRVAGSEESPPLHKVSCETRAHLVLPTLSDGYPKLWGKLPIYYSPVRRSHLQLLFRRIEKTKSRSTCMPNPRRQCSFWARIKLSDNYITETFWNIYLKQIAPFLNRNGDRESFSFQRSKNQTSTFPTQWPFSLKRRTRYAIGSLRSTAFYHLFFSFFLDRSSKGIRHI